MPTASGDPTPEDITAQWNVVQGIAAKTPPDTYPTLREYHQRLVNHAHEISTSTSNGYALMQMVISSLSLIDRVQHGAANPENDPRLASLLSQLNTLDEQHKAAPPAYKTPGGSSLEQEASRLSKEASAEYAESESLLKSTRLPASIDPDDKTTTPTAPTDNEPMRPINLSPGDIPTTRDAKPDTQHERFTQALLKLKHCEYDLRMALEDGSDLTLTTMDLKTILSMFGKASTGAKPALAKRLAALQAEFRASLGSLNGFRDALLSKEQALMKDSETVMPKATEPTEADPLQTPVSVSGKGGKVATMASFPLMGAAILETQLAASQQREQKLQEELNSVRAGESKYLENWREHYSSDMDKALKAAQKNEADALRSLSAHQASLEAITKENEMMHEHIRFNASEQATLNQDSHRKNTEIGALKQEVKRREDTYIQQEERWLEKCAEVTALQQARNTMYAEISALEQEVQKGRVEKSAELTALQQEVRRREIGDTQQEERWHEQHRVLNASFMGKPTGGSDSRSDVAPMLRKPTLRKPQLPVQPEHLKDLALVSPQPPPTLNNWLETAPSYDAVPVRSEFKNVRVVHTHASVEAAMRDAQRSGKEAFASRGSAPTSGDTWKPPDDDPYGRFTSPPPGGGLRPSTESLSMHPVDGTDAKKLGFIMVPTLTVPAVPNSAWSQMILGHFGPLLYGRTESPLFWECLTYGVTMIDPIPYDPRRHLRPHVLERAIELIQDPIRRDVREYCHARGPEHDDQLAAEFLRHHVSAVVPRPAHLALKGSPDYVAVVRVHGGWSAIEYENIRRANPNSHNHPSIATTLRALETVLVRFALDSKPASKIEGPRLIAKLHTDYLATPDEREVINEFIRTLTQTPNVMECDYTPPTDTSTNSHYRHSDRYSHGARKRGEYDRPPRLGHTLLAQLRSEVKAMSDWHKSHSIQLWLLRQILTFKNGMMQPHIKHLLYYDGEEIFESIRLLVIEKITERFQMFTDMFVSPQALLLMGKVAENHGAILDSSFAAFQSGELDMRRVENAFVDGLCKLFLAIRSVPYAEDPELMARAEVRRLARLERQEQSTDAQWWTEVVRRYRNWVTLLGEQTMMLVASELRDFLPYVASLLKERSNVTLVMHLAGEFMEEVARSLGKTPEELLGSDLKLTTRPSCVPALNPEIAKVRPIKSLLETVEDLRLIHDVGMRLSSLGSTTRYNAIQMTQWFLDFTLKRVGETGVSATMSQNHALTGENQLMLLTSGAATSGIMILGVSDVLMTSEPWPRVNEHAYNHTPAAQAMALEYQESITQAASKQAPPLAHQTIPSTTMLASGASESLHALEKRLLAAEGNLSKQLARQEADLARNREHHDAMHTQTAHLAELLRKQIENSAAPEMRHATRSSTSRIAFTDHTADSHARDTTRRNLGVPSRKQQGARVQRALPTRPTVDAQGLKYGDKPPTKWGEIKDEDVLAHLQNQFGITDEAAWERQGQLPCPWCPRPDHRLWHCLKVFAASERGKAFFGADKAAKRIRDAFSNASQPMSMQALAELYYQGVAPEDLEAVEYGLHAIIESSEDLCVMCEENTCTMNVIGTFDAAHAAMTEHMQMRPAQSRQPTSTVAPVLVAPADLLALLRQMAERSDAPAHQPPDVGATDATPEPPVVPTPQSQAK